MASAATAAVQPLDRTRARRKAAWRRRRLVVLLMAPWLIGFSVFFGYPLVMSVYLSFTHYDLLSSPKWIGTANYRYLFTQDSQVGQAVKNTLWIIAVMVPLQVVFAFGVAMMLARARRGAGFFRTIFYLPALAPPVAATLAFVYILNPATGPVNILLKHLGIEGPLWFQSPTWSKPSLVLLGMWGVGNIMIIFLAAILDVPRHLYESAELDGFVDNFARRIASFEKRPLELAKKLVNARAGIPSEAERRSSNQSFVTTTTWPETQALISELLQNGFQQRGDFELRMGHHLGHQEMEVSPMEDEKIYLLAELTILPGFLEEVKTILKEALIPTLQEPGCEALYETGRKDDPHKLVFFEVFSSAAAHEFHLEQDYTKRMLVSLDGNVSGVPTLTKLSAL